VFVFCITFIKGLYYKISKLLILVCQLFDNQVGSMIVLIIYDLNAFAQFSQKIKLNIFWAFLASSRTFAENRGRFQIDFQ